MSEEKTIRAEFEAWATHPDRAGKMPVDAYTNGAYKDSRTYAAYYGWISSRKAIAAPSAWMPIESAPKDMGSRLYRVNGFCIQGFIDATGVLCAQNDRQPWRKMYGKPTHWMPLPKAP